MAQFFFLFLLVLPSRTVSSESSSSEIPIALNFSNLKNSHHANGKIVEIKGFLYEDSKGNKILASEPNLRSCCIGSKQQQIVLTGSIDTVNQHYPVTIRGLYSIVREKETKYAIGHAVVMEGHSQWNLKWAFLLLFGMVVGSSVLLSKQIRLHTFDRNS